ncbi:MAG: MBL fold metallo-hydrolase [Thermoanaerobaculia bacterium]|nr:MBL fold metallo-hydrolase [Thermoanaerobaculia bacterium]
MTTLPNYVAVGAAIGLLLCGGSPTPADGTTGTDPKPDGDLRIVYLANAGFFLTDGERDLLVDALFGTGIDGYAALPEGERAVLESGRPPYDDVDLALATHYHADHYDADAVARFLAANPRAVFVSTQQAVDELRDLDAGEAAIGRRAFGYRLDEGEVERRSIDGIDLRLFQLHHGRERPDIQNLGLLIEICGLTVLHVGDTEADADDLRRAGLAGLEPDVALLPSWFLRPGPWEAAVEVLRPRRIVAMHLPEADAPANYFWGEARSRDALEATILRRHPDTFVPRTPGESVRIPCRPAASTR